jgi:hypothetical protein
VPDLEALADELRAAIEELAAAAGEAAPDRTLRPRRPVGAAE